MPKRFLCCILLFFLTASALGESLHALPVFEHHTSDVCDSTSTHFDGVELKSESKCDLCEALVDFQVSPNHEAPSFAVISAERQVFRHQIFISTTDVFFSDNRGPPERHDTSFRNMGCS